MENINQNNNQYQSLNNLKQLKILLLKNWIIFKRLKKSAFFLLIGPILINFLVIFFQQQISDYYETSLENPIIHSLSLIKPCRINRFDGYQPPDCITIGYGIIGDSAPWIDHALNYIVERTDLEMGKDIQLLYQGKDVNATQYFDYLSQNPNQVMMGVIFCTDKMFVVNETINCQNPEFLNIQNPEKPTKYKNSLFYTLVMNNTFYQWNQSMRSNWPLNFAINLNSLKAYIDSSLAIYYNPQYDGNDYKFKKKKKNDFEKTKKSEKIEKNYLKQMYSYFFEPGNIYEAFYLNNENIYNQIEQEPQVLLNALPHTLLKPVTPLRESYPRVPSRPHNNSNVIAMFGAFYYFMMPIYLFLMFMNEFITEKVYKIRQGLNIFGISHFCYGMSWVISGAVLSGFISVYIILIGDAFLFDFFLDTNFIILFMLFFLFTCSLITLSLFIATLINNLNVANTISYLFILTSIVLEFLLSCPIVMNGIYSDDQKNNAGLIIFKIIGSLYPPYVYSLVFQTIVTKSGYSYDGFQNAWVKGPGYGFKDLTKKIHQKYDGVMSEGTYTRPSGIEGFGFLFMQIFFFGFLAYYFDSVLQENRGVAKPYNFLCKNKKKSKKNKNQDKNENNLQARLLQQTENEMQNSEFFQNYNENNNNRFNINVKSQNINPQNNNLKSKDENTLQINSLSKAYIIQKGFLKKNKKKQALRNVNLQIKQGELTSLLGHNGSGKTTLINILTGMLQADEGQIEINGVNLQENMEQVRKIISVCPQFDILWEYLTPIEHFEIFGQIRGLSQNQIQQEIEEKLSAVNLLDEKKNYINTFSGGMKRRLSLAISSIGNPQYIFLDEPTTGMDINIRKQIWDLVEKMKNNTGIVLTTHSMEEADILSDSIAVLVEGTIKCQGSQLFLKNNFGGGYRIQIIAKDQNKSKQIQTFISQNLTKMLLEKNSSGSLLYTIPIIETQEISRFFALMEQKQSKYQPSISTQETQDKNNVQIEYFRQNIQDWGVSHATLEEVFINITRQTQKQINQLENLENQQILNNF